MRSSSEEPLLCLKRRDPPRLLQEVITTNSCVCPRPCSLVWWWQLYFVKNVMHESKDTHTGPLQATNFIQKESSSSVAPSGAGQGSSNSLPIQNANPLFRDTGNNVSVMKLYEQQAAEWGAHQQGSSLNLLQDPGDGATKRVSEFWPCVSSRWR